MSSAALHIAVILSPFLAIPLVSWAGGGRDMRSRLPALIPGLLAIYFTNSFTIVSRSGPFSVTTGWAPGLNLSLSFRFDGLSTLFAALIAAVGVLIVVYAAKYLELHPHAGRFNAALFAFMLVISTLFLVSGLFLRQRRTTDLTALGGMYRSQPAIAFLALVPLFSLAGVPPLSGFVAKLAVITPMSAISSNVPQRFVPVEGPARLAINLCRKSIAAYDASSGTLII